MTKEMLSVDRHQLKRLFGVFMETSSLPIQAAPPDHLYIELTNQCNLRCKHCYLDAGPGGNHTLSSSLVRRALHDFATFGGMSVTFSGGEPLLHPDWPALVGYARSLNLVTAVVTNGLLLDSAAVKDLRELGATVTLSLDGASRETHESIRGAGSYAKALAALDQLEASHSRDQVIIAFTPTNTNVDDLIPLARHISERGFYRLYVSPLEDRGRSLVHEDKLSLDDESRMRLLIQIALLNTGPYRYMDIDCGHLNYFFHRLLTGEGDLGDPIEGTLRINPDGDIFLTAYSDDRRFLLGDLLNGSIRQAWQSDATRFLLNAVDQRRLGLPDCNSCPYWIICGGGSPVRAYMRHGSFQKPDEFCRAKQMFLDRWFSALR
ncbi:radical SAM protein [Desulfococcus sp.]